MISSEAVAALNGRWRRIETAFAVFECPIISPVEEPLSNMKAWPNLAWNARQKLPQWGLLGY